MVKSNNLSGDSVAANHRVQGIQKLKIKKAYHDRDEGENNVKNTSKDDNKEGLKYKLSKFADLLKSSGKQRIKSEKLEGRSRSERRNKNVERKSEGSSKPHSGRSDRLSSRPESKRSDKIGLRTRNRYSDYVEPQLQSKLRKLPRPESQQQSRRWAVSKPNSKHVDRSSSRTVVKSRSKQCSSNSDKCSSKQQENRENSSTPQNKQEGKLKTSGDRLRSNGRQINKTDIKSHTKNNDTSFIKEELKLRKNGLKEKYKKAKTKHRDKARNKMGSNMEGTIDSVYSLDKNTIISPLPCEWSNGKITKTQDNPEVNSDEFKINKSKMKKQKAKKNTEFCRCSINQSFKKNFANMGNKEIKDKLRRTCSKCWKLCLSENNILSSQERIQMGNRNRSKSVKFCAIEKTKNLKEKAEEICKQNKMNNRSKSRSADIREISLIDINNHELIDPIKDVNHFKDKTIHFQEDLEDKNIVKNEIEGDVDERKIYDVKELYLMENMTEYDQKLKQRYQKKLRRDKYVMKEFNNNGDNNIAEICDDENKIATRDLLKNKIKNPVSSKYDDKDQNVNPFYRNNKKLNKFSLEKVMFLNRNDNTMEHSSKGIFIHLKKTLGKRDEICGDANGAGDKQVHYGSVTMIYDQMKKLLNYNSGDVDDVPLTHEGVRNKLQTQSPVMVNSYAEKQNELPSHLFKMLQQDSEKIFNVLAKNKKVHLRIKESSVQSIKKKPITNVNVATVKANDRSVILEPIAKKFDYVLLKKSKKVLNLEESTREQDLMDSQSTLKDSCFVMPDGPITPLSYVIENITNKECCYPKSGLKNDLDLHSSNIQYDTNLLNEGCFNSSLCDFEQFKNGYSYKSNDTNSIEAIKNIKKIYDNINQKSDESDYMLSISSDISRESPKLSLHINSDESAVNQANNDKCRVEDKHVRWDQNVANSIDENTIVETPVKDVKSLDIKDSRSTENINKFTNMSRNESVLMSYTSHSNYNSKIDRLHYNKDKSEDETLNFINNSQFIKQDEEWMNNTLSERDSQKLNTHNCHPSNVKEIDHCYACSPSGRIIVPDLSKKTAVRDKNNFSIQEVPNSTRVLIKDLIQFNNILEIQFSGKLNININKDNIELGDPLVIDKQDSNKTPLSIKLNSEKNSTTVQAGNEEENKNELPVSVNGIKKEFITEDSSFHDVHHVENNDASVQTISEKDSEVVLVENIATTNNLETENMDLNVINIDDEQNPGFSKNDPEMNQVDKLESIRYSVNIENCTTSRVGELDKIENVNKDDRTVNKKLLEINGKELPVNGLNDNIDMQVKLKNHKKFRKGLELPLEESITKKNTNDTPKVVFNNICDYCISADKKMKLCLLEEELCKNVLRSDIVLNTDRSLHSQKFQPVKVKSSKQKSVFSSIVKKFHMVKRSFNNVQQAQTVSSDKTAGKNHTSETRLSEAECPSEEKQKKHKIIQRYNADCRSCYCRLTGQQDERNVVHFPHVSDKDKTTLEENTEDCLNKSMQTCCTIQCRTSNQFIDNDLIIKQNNSTTENKNSLTWKQCQQVNIQNLIKTHQDVSVQSTDNCEEVENPENMVLNKKKKRLLFFLINEKEEKVKKKIGFRSLTLKVKKKVFKKKKVKKCPGDDVAEFKKVPPQNLITLTAKPRRSQQIIKDWIRKISKKNKTVQDIQEKLYKKLNKIMASEIKMSLQEVFDIIQKPQFHENQVSQSGRKIFDLVDTSNYLSDDKNYIMFTEQLNVRGFLVSIGFKDDVACEAQENVQTNERIQDAISEARCWVNKILISQGLLIYILAVMMPSEVNNYFHQVVEAIINNRITNVGTLLSIMMVLKRYQRGKYGIKKIISQEYVKEFLPKRASETERSHEENRTRFIHLYSTAKKAAAKIGSTVGKESAGLLARLTVNYSPGLKPYMSLLAHYIAQRIIKEEGQLSMAVSYLQNLHVKLFDQTSFEINCGLEQNAVILKVDKKPKQSMTKPDERLEKDSVKQIFTHIIQEKGRRNILSNSTSKVNDSHTSSNIETALERKPSTMDLLNARNK